MALGKTAYSSGLPGSDSGFGVGRYFSSCALTRWGRLILLLSFASGYQSASAQPVVETFGAGSNQFTMEFVTIGNPNNAADTTGNPNPAGSVAYAYNLGKQEVSRDMINKANTAGGLGITMADMSGWGGNGVNRPATGITWNEAATYVNWLNTSTGGTPAYKFVGGTFTLWSPGDAGYNPSNEFRNSRAKYVIASNNEWYKGAYGNRDGTWNNYATGSDSAPTAVASGTTANTAVYSAQGPADIASAGGLSPYETMGQSGNVWEWNETGFDGMNNTADENREVRGGTWGSLSGSLEASVRLSYSPAFEYDDIGFRVAVVSLESPVVLSSGLLAALKFEGNLSDSSALGLHAGSWSGGGTASYVLQSPGSGVGAGTRSALFNGTTDRIDLANSAALNMNDGVPFSMSAWIKTDFGDGRRVILAKAAGAWGNTPALFVDDEGKLRFDNFEVSEVHSNTTVRTGNWIHVAVTYDGSTYRLYVNGLADGEKAFTGSNESGNSWTFSIGGSLNTSYPSGMFKGSIDEVQFWGRTLSPTEVATVADSGVSLNLAPSVPFTYTSDNEEVTITGYTGTGGAVVIPATIGGGTVTTIGQNAFQSKTSVTSVVIPNGVTTILDAAFAGCSSMTAITLPNSLTSIGGYVFDGCSSLQSITIPDGVTSIGSNAFAFCTSLPSITLPSGLSKIMSGTFWTCTNLTSITIPSSVNEIEYNAFLNCSKLASVYFLRNTPPTIGSDAFKNIASGAMGYYPAAASAAWTAALALNPIPGLSFENNVPSINSGGPYVAATIEDFGLEDAPASLPFTVVPANGDGGQSEGVIAWNGTTYSTGDSIFFKSGKDEGGDYSHPELVIWGNVINGTPDVYEGYGGVVGPGTMIGSAGIFSTEYNFHRLEFTGRRYLALVANGYYGYADVTVGGANDTDLTVHAVVFNTIKGQAIAAGATPSGLTGGTGGGTGGVVTPIGGGTGGGLSTVPAPVLNLPATLTYGQNYPLPGAVQAMWAGESNLNTAIPDLNPGGLSRTLNVSGLDLLNYRLTVGLDIAGTGSAAVLGDYYAYLRHTSTDGLSFQTRVLLDRVGKTESDPTGSLANGIQAIFSDTFSSNIQNLSDLTHQGKLSGGFAPASILNNSGNGLNTMGSIGWNGTWTLFVEDQSQGGTGNLVSWFMQFEDLSAGSETAASSGGLVYQLSFNQQDWNTSNSKARIVGNQLEALSGTGTIYIRAKYADSVDNWSASQTITLAKANQTISFPEIGPRSLAPAFLAGATTTSGLSLAYASSDTNKATVDTNGLVTPVTSGQVTITVSQSGDDNYVPASVPRSFFIQATPISATWGLAKIFSQDSTNAPTEGVKKGTNNYLYTRVQEAAAVHVAQIQAVEITNSSISPIYLSQTNPLPNGDIAYTSFSNPPSYSSYEQATNATPDGTYDFIGRTASNAVVTNTVVQWSNNLSNYPQQAPQIVGTNWVWQSLRLAEPAASNTISWNAWTNSSTNSAVIRLQVVGRPAASNSIGGGYSYPSAGGTTYSGAGGVNSYSSAGAEKVLYEESFDASTTNAVIPANKLSTNQIYRVYLSFGEFMNEGNEPGRALAVAATTTEFRVVTGPNYPPSNPEIIGAELGNIDVSPGQDVVGTLALVQDSDVGDTVTYSLPFATYPDSNDNSNFYIMDGILRKYGNFDYSFKSSFTISIRATDSYGLYSDTTYTITVNGLQTITFAEIPSKTYLDAPFSLTATAPGGPVTFVSSNLQVATIENNSVTIVGAGQTTITANQIGGGGYKPALPVPQILTVAKAGTTISAGGETSFTYSGNGQGPDTIEKSGSGGAVTLSYVGVNGTSYGPSADKPVIAGSYTVSAALAGDGNFNGATSAAFSFTINKADSSIIVAPIASPISSGQTLANSTLSGGTASVDGAFAFTTPTTAPSVGTSSQGVTFTPTNLANYKSATTAVNVTVIDLDLPIAGTDNFTAAPISGNVVKYAVAQLLANDAPSNPTLNPNDSRFLSITGVADASSGSKVTRKGSWIIYEPNAIAINAGSDTFTYTLSNGSQTAGGTVSILFEMPDFMVEVSIERVADRAGGGKTVTFAVSPERTFEVQASSNLSDSQSWSVIAAAATSLVDGRLVVEDPGAGQSRFYRVKWLPYGAQQPAP